MKKRSLLWFFAIVITLFTAYYQKITGPTYPVSGEVVFNNENINYKLYRSHGGDSDHQVSIIVQDTSITGVVSWKRYKTKDSYTDIEMTRNGDSLTAKLPHQPPAGKLRYKITLFGNNESIVLHDGESVIIRHKGDVPAIYLIPHIIFIFLALLFSARAGVEFFAKEKKLALFTNLTLMMLILGGFIFGPIVQKFAFDAYWTGFPFGHDLTDNKVLIALIGWLIAFVMLKKSKKPELWVLFAALVMMITFLIPHSVLGSELDYNKIDKTKTEIIETNK